MEKFVYLESAAGSGRFDLRGAVDAGWDRAAFEADLERIGHGGRRVLVASADKGARDVPEADLVEGTVPTKGKARKLAEEGSVNV